MSDEKETEPTQAPEICAAYEMFKTPSKEITSGGIWLDYPGFSIKVAYAGKSNKKYMAAVKRLMKPYKYFIGNDDVVVPKKTEEKIGDAMRQVYAESIIVDWKNVTDEQGNPLSCTPNNARNFLTKLPLLYEDVEKQSQALKNFRDEERKEDSEN